MARMVMAWIRFAFMVGWALLGWLYVALACVLFLADIKSIRFESHAIVTAKWRPWFAKVYPFSTTLGRGIVFYPGVRDAEKPLDDRVERHERVHVWQMEDISFRFLLVGLLVGLVTDDWLLGLFLWLSAPAWLVTNFVMALLRFSHNAEWPKDEGLSGWKRFTKFAKHLAIDIAYRDSDHERSAYAQTATMGGDSWWQFRERQRAEMTGEPTEDHESPL